MPKTPQSQVLIAGAGPIGLTAAIELTRRGIDCRIVDPLPEPPQYAKAVGVQPRTLEVFEAMGVLPRILDAAIQMHGQIVYVNGEKVAQVDFACPTTCRSASSPIPQYATERILREELAMHGVQVERGVRLTGFEQDADGVSATLADDAGEQTVRAAYLVGADGAHSAVRKALGLTFEGAAFDEQYMLGDVEVDWSMSRGLRRSARCIRSTGRNWRCYCCRPSSPSGSACRSPGMSMTRSPHVQVAFQGGFRRRRCEVVWHQRVLRDRSRYSVS